MSALVVGGDNLGVIKDNLRDMGFDSIYHVTGRKKKRARQISIPDGVDLILILTDYIHHNLMKMVKEEAKCHEADCIFARRSWSHICKKMQMCGCDFCKGCG
ncbi:DUF2325 domain-containing protein [Halarsenatibacter silvermanii]|uniref:Dihydroorotate dehydrogenase n=1 Tax=Halarsenatibacter silvermanii TaxID=321763 RepID=A0A1G9IQ94_9FIRM|nr:DUF2325 domain-containing protein [Halarsenatibacter silvermanii]SDL27332.1 hypothetical protein SAMN04488692_10333 [Halarsenatibacter silvermanii]